MNIKSGERYPACALSNFAPHRFVVDGVECYSMEGFLQSLKFKNPEMQKEVCKMVGAKAKQFGANKRWYEKQILYWKGTPISRHSKYYQDLLDKAYEALAENTKFKRALLATGNAKLTHNIGKANANETILTKKEFISRLVKIRKRLLNGELF